ncbi:hypothetical protein VN0420_04050 [Helicobacter pylori]|nr:hypothetical protein VN0420_04050 [Helicobacter pylori]
MILREVYSKAITRENARESIKKALGHTATAKACKSNDAKGCYALATLYNESVAKDEKQMTEKS